MAKPYLLYKKHSGIYYAELLLPDGSRTKRKSTGTENRAEAEKIVMGWIVNGNIPARINGKEVSTFSTDKRTTMEKKNRNTLHCGKKAE